MCLYALGHGVPAMHGEGVEVRVDTDNGLIVITGGDRDGGYEVELLPWQARRLAAALLDRVHQLEEPGKTYCSVSGRFG